jgi:hypothetical protein
MIPKLAVLFMFIGLVMTARAQRPMKPAAFTLDLHLDGVPLCPAHAGAALLWSLVVGVGATSMFGRRK